jgi:3-methyladenine DNA glycosylase AlkD
VLAQTGSSRLSIVVGELAGSLSGLREGLGLRLGRCRDGRCVTSHNKRRTLQPGDAFPQRRELLIDLVAHSFAADPKDRERAKEYGAQDDEEDRFHTCIVRTRMNRPTAAAVRSRMKELASPEIAEHSSRFFKTGPGEYGEGDRFHGIRVPVVRKLVRQFRNLPDRALLSLLRSGMHEERLFAVLLLVDRYDSAPDDAVREAVYRLYLGNMEHVNNWDLVDGSAHRIIGPWLESRDRSLLYELARSDDLWSRRVAIMSTLHMIKQRDFADALAISEILLHDDEDLIHKAVGWMLREVGNRDCAAEEAFLAAHYRTMPRTMLRYSIEKFPEPLRLAYLKGEV